MSLLQENIVYILLLPVVLQIALPLAMLILYVVISPIYSLFKSKQPLERTSRRLSENWSFGQNREVPTK
jgi:hypothetical protein